MNLRERRVPRGKSLWGAWSWIVLGLLLVLAYGLAVVFGEGRLGHRLLDGLKLFPQFPGVDNGRSWPYILARQLAALALLAATVGVVAAVLSSRIAELKARFRRDHAVVCGLGETGLRNALAFRAYGIPTTCIELTPQGDAVDEARAAGALVLHRDAMQVSSLQAAGADKAEWIVCSCGADSANTRIASIVVELASRVRARRVPKVQVQTDNPHLARLLRGPLASVGLVHLNFFNNSHVWSRALLDEAPGPFADLGQAPPHIVVLGSTRLGSAVVVEAARRWHSVMSTNGLNRRSTILFIGSNAVTTARQLGKRYPALERVCDLRAVDDELEPSGLLDIPKDETWDGVFACLDDHSMNLALALETERTAPDGTLVFVPTGAAMDAFAPMFTGIGRIHTVSLTAEKTSLDLLHDQVTETLARLTHEAYLVERRSQPDFGDRPADRPWHELSEADVRANRSHGEGIIEQLRSVWYEIEPLYDWDERPAELAESAVETMAELEHARWCREKLGEGWRHASKRNDVEKLHDLLVPWPELPHSAREINRALVRQRPSLLAAAGFRITRDPAREELARHVHEDYVAQVEPEGTAHLVAWNELSEEKRESNRAAVDHVAVKLTRIGCRVVPQGRGRATKFTFSDEEIEVMAQLEHERWLREQAAAGTRYGPSRDEEAGLHPSMVEWERLPEDEREKDREIARKIPEQLLAVGYGVIREDPSPMRSSLPEG
jgi:voltage-gated potassium channel Kch